MSITLSCLAKGTGTWDGRVEGLDDQNEEVSVAMELVFRERIV